MITKLCDNVKLPLFTLRLSLNAKEQIKNVWFVSSVDPKVKSLDTHTYKHIHIININYLSLIN